MNMFVFEEVAARRITPAEAAERLVEARQIEPKRRSWPRRVAFAFVVTVLGALVPSLGLRRF